MDHDASPPGACEPLWPLNTLGSAVRIGAIGAGLCAAAAVVGAAVAGMASPPAVTSSVRLLFVFVGSVTAGAAIALNSARWQTWAIGAGTAVLAWFGIPEHWDSFRLLVGVIGAVAAAGAVLYAVPRKTA